VGIRDQLVDRIADLISGEKSYNVAAVCVRYGLAEQADDDPNRSKAKYVEQRLKGLSVDELVTLGRKLHVDYGDRAGFECASARLREALHLALGPPRISEITRRELAARLGQLGICEGGGKRGVVRTLEAALPEIEVQARGHYGGWLNAMIHRHMVCNQDWNCEYMFERVGLLTCSDQRLLRFLEEVVHPLARTGDEQAQYVAVINEHIHRDGFRLVEAGSISGYPTFHAEGAKRGVSGKPKNLIFASTGFKPEIILGDAIANDVRIVKHAELCLIYDEPFPDGVFTWRHLVSWWARREQLEETERGVEEALYRRLRDAVQNSKSPPEELLFKSYYTLRREHGPEIPVLLPQVYLHYDPATTRTLGGVRRLARERMDFLLLLSPSVRIVIEVDGAQHYSDASKRASPRLYAEMVAEDRRLRLTGYEVYRFGGAELNERGGERLVVEFFEQLFERHGVCR
jgi:very-short-patch-repair endonuclease